VESDPLSTNVVNPAALAAEPEEARPAPSVARARGWRPAAAVLAPAGAAALALLVHHYLPTRQELPRSWMDRLPAWQHPYPLLLLALLAASLLAAAAQAAWRPLRPWVRHYAPLVAGALGLACAAEVVTAKTAWMPQPYFPGPDEVLGALVDDRAVLLESTWHSLRLLLSGYAAGVAAGLVTGVLIGWFQRARYWVLPLLKVLGPLPATALVALVMMMPVPEFFCGMALIAWAVWFPVTMLTSSGIMNVRVSHLDVARTLGAGRLYLILRVAVPSALPSVFVGLFIGLVVSFLTLIVAESVGVKAGLGWYIPWRKGYADYAYVWAALVIVAAFCSTLMTVLFKVRDRVLKWQKGVIKW
jgi:NitT/TauT family transport system permease protein